jgi:ABC-type branched-subunit amino acid transport system ATPase component
VSLTVGGGEIVTLLGANGRGKSTTRRATSGLVRPAAGRIGWEARDVQETLAVIPRINAEGVSVLLVEQNARAALGVAARGYVLETGRVVAPGPSATLAADARAARLSRFGSG